MFSADRALCAQAPLAAVKQYFTELYRIEQQELGQCGAPSDIFVQFIPWTVCGQRRHGMFIIQFEYRCNLTEGSSMSLCELKELEHPLLDFNKTKALSVNTEFLYLFILEILLELLYLMCT